MCRGKCLLYIMYAFVLHSSPDLTLFRVISETFATYRKTQLNVISMTQINPLCMNLNIDCGQARKTL